MALSLGLALVLLAGIVFLEDLILKGICLHMLIVDFDLIRTTWTQHF
ncbi:MAG: hypothetical protein PHY30_01925 [Candidatus Pacebacteria bacterium]|nr:hypothetical protein [Candidatus Paceibacterota bacterium]